MRIKPMLLCGALLLLNAATAQAHVTLEQPEAVAGSAYKAVLRIGHGCEGSATTRVSVLLPPGLRGAKPVPKPGWTLALRREKLATPYESHGRSIGEELAEVSWTARSEEFHLQDDWFDEFVVRGSLPAAPGTLWFKVRQSCVKGEWDWSEVPASGGSTKGLKAPAVRLDVVAAPALPAEHKH
ncbi:YcnI family copper-binding membrane protein [Paucibacter soli]|uniref:YcnI family copper-binding membrane protein n=1 Tax=Paucibacter soli TaxID=3133433 RepID=UPI0030A29768